MRQILSTLSFLLLFTPALLAQNADAVCGKWLTPERDSHVLVYRTVDNKYAAKIVWLQNPLETDGSGQPNLDDKNEDESLRKRPILNMVFLSGFVYDGENRWREGTIYNPRDGKTYSCKMTLTDKNNLEVRGYVGISLFGKTQKWTRLVPQ
jgi:uncharacterized protein (DUF2147 family)